MTDFTGRVLGVLFGGRRGESRDPRYLQNAIDQLLEMRRAREVSSALPVTDVAPEGIRVGPAAPPPSSPPAPTPPPAPPPPSPGPASGGTSAESYRQQAERAMRDTAARQHAPPRQPFGIRGVIREGEIVRAGAGAARAIARAIGPIGVIIEAAIPAELGSGELSPEDMLEQVLEDAADVPEPTFGEDIARAGGVAAGGIVLGGQVILDQLGRGLPPVFDVGEEPIRIRPVPQPSIPPPAPVRQPEIPSAAPPVPVIRTPLPSPAPSSSSSSSSRSRSRSTPRSQTATPPIASPLELLGVLAGAATRRSSLTVPRTRSIARDALTMPQPETLTSSLTSSSTSSPTSSPVAQPLTGFQPQLLSSGPPTRTRTRTRTKECECPPRKRKPKRKCAASAPLRWAGGPRKGQPAGSRCYSFKG